MDKVNRYYGEKDPDIAKCETRAAGSVIPGTTLSVYYCSLDNAECRYARSFAYDYLCRHSDSHSFAQDREEGMETSP